MVDFGAVAPRGRPSLADGWIWHHLNRAIAYKMPEYYDRLHSRLMRARDWARGLKSEDSEEDEEGARPRLKKRGARAWATAYPARQLVDRNENILHVHAVADPTGMDS